MKKLELTAALERAATHLYRYLSRNAAGDVMIEISGGRYSFRRRGAIHAFVCPITGKTVERDEPAYIESSKNDWRKQLSIDGVTALATLKVREVMKLQTESISHPEPYAEPREVGAENLSLL